MWFVLLLSTALIVSMIVLFPLQDARIGHSIFRICARIRKVINAALPLLPISNTIKSILENFETIAKNSNYPVKILVFAYSACLEVTNSRWPGILLHSSLETYF